MSVFLNILKIADFRWKNTDVIRTQGCVTWFMYFLELLWVRYNCAKFHQCRIYVTDFREEGPFCSPPSQRWAAPKKPILKRFNNYITKKTRIIYSHPLIVGIHTDLATAVALFCFCCCCCVVVAVILLLYLLLLFNKTGQNATGRVKLNIFRIFKASYLYNQKHSHFIFKHSPLSMFCFFLNEGHVFQKS